MQDPHIHVAKAIEGAVLDCAGGCSVASLLFSGGVDSSLLAWILKSRGFKVELVTVSLAGGGDPSRAEDSARLMGLECAVHLVSTESILAIARELRRLAPDLSLNDVAIRTAMRVAISLASEKVIMCARGADELFLGFAHIRGLRGKELVARAEADLRKVAEDDWPSMKTYAASKGKELVAPFLADSFMKFISTIPWEARASDNESKWLIRQAARDLGLPSEIVNRPKKGFQYGSGIYKELKKSL